MVCDGLINKLYFSLKLFGFREVSTCWLTILWWKTILFRTWVVSVFRVFWEATGFVLKFCGNCVVFCCCLSLSEQTFILRMASSLAKRATFNLCYWGRLSSWVCSSSSISPYCSYDMVKITTMQDMSDLWF